MFMMSFRRRREWCGAVVALAVAIGFTLANGVLAYAPCFRPCPSPAAPPMLFFFPPKDPPLQAALLHDASKNPLSLYSSPDHTI